MSTLIARFLNRYDVHTLDVMRKSLRSILVKVLALALGLGISVTLGRSLGAEGLGIINLTQRIAMVVMVLCLLGFPNVLIKEVAIGREAKMWQRISNATYTASCICGVATCITVGVLICLTSWLANDVFRDARLMWPLIVTLCVIPVQVIASIYLSGLIGHQKVWQSHLLDQALSLLVVAMVLVVIVGFNIEITIVRIAIVYAASRVSSLFGISIYWRRVHSHTLESRRVCWSLLRSALPLLLISSSGVLAVNVDTIMLGWLGNTAQVGLYSVAVRLSLLTSLLLQVTNTTLAPKVAVMYAEGKFEELEIMVQRVTGTLILAGLLVLLVFILGGRLILSVWGVAFTPAYGILLVLSVGQFVNLATGANGLIMTMCGEEKALCRIKVGELTINVILNIILIRQYYAFGAAFATALTVSGSNIARLIYVKRKLGISILKI